ncbi:MAG: DNA polymerase III subunit delta, partial [Ignavibacteriales bacterium]
MAKNNFPPVSECIKSVKAGKIKPVYFLFGEDSYSVYKAVDEILKSTASLIFSDFDRMTYRGGEDNNLSDILGLASTFPFSSEKKLVFIKDFEKFRDKKGLVNYLKSPPEFTILVIINNGPVSSPSSEPFKSLILNDFIYEARELKGKSLVQWVISYVEECSCRISQDDAQMLVEIVGENRGLIQDQLEKIITYSSGKKEISRQDILYLAAEMKEYTIFDLLNAVGRKETADAFKFAYNLLEKGKGGVYIIFMLTKYFTTLSRMSELINQNMSYSSAAKALSIAEWTYKDYMNARKLYTDQQVNSAAEALLKADTIIKTTSADEKTVISVL